MDVIDYIREEVERQGHDTATPDGWLRVAWMLEAWAEAMAAVDQYPTSQPTVTTAEALGLLIEPLKNYMGFRQCGVRVGTRICPDPGLVRQLLAKLWESRDMLGPIEFYKAFELIHPFVDGNGRVGKILLNWLNGTLRDPIFPPNDLWGEEIRNP